MALQAVIFDLYGTLVDIETNESDPGMYFVLSQFLTYYEIFLKPEELAARYQEVSAAHLLEHPGPYGEIDVFQVFEEVLEQAWGRKPERALVIWVARLFRSLSRRRFGLFDDTLPALEELSQHYRLGIVSDAQWVFAEPEIAILGLDQFFRLKIFSSKYGFKKPDERLFITGMEKLGVSPHDSVYIGDNLSKDIVGAKKTGMKFILFGSSNSEYNE